MIRKRPQSTSGIFDSHRPLHFSLPGVSLRCPRTRLCSSLSFPSLDAVATVPLIECVDRSLSRVRSRWSHPFFIDPLLFLATGRFPGAKFSGATTGMGESPHAHRSYLPHCVATPSRARTPCSKRPLIASTRPSPKVSASRGKAPEASWVAGNSKFTGASVAASRSA
jgi:hypothetical protein